jgi:hypothetical protein
MAESGRLLAAARAASYARPFLLVLPALAVAGCSKTYEFDSAWRDRAIVVDGNNEDWEGVTSYIDEAKIAVGILNDERFLYVNLVLWEPTQRMQAMGMGLTLWFDPEGGKEKTLGIRYPLGMEGGGPFGGEPFRGGRPEGRPQGDGPQDGERQDGNRRGTRADRENPEEMQGKFLEAATELEVLGPRDIDRHRYDLTDAGGVEVRVNPLKDCLVYELKVPLQKEPGDKFALGVAAGEKIGVVLETPEMERPQMPGGPGGGGGRPPGGGPGGGMGGGRRPSGGMGMPGGGRGSPPEPLELKAKIRLAAASPAQDAPRGS